MRFRNAAPFQALIFLEYTFTPALVIEDIFLNQCMMLSMDTLSQVITTHLYNIKKVILNLNANQGIKF